MSMTSCAWPFTTMSLPSLYIPFPQLINDISIFDRTDSYKHSSLFCCLPAIMSSSDQASFVNLPYEIRCIVYDYYLSSFLICHPKLFSKPFEAPAQPMNRPVMTVIHNPIEIPLLHTCQQIYDEALPLVYHSSDFAFDVSTSAQHPPSTPLYRLVEKIGSAKTRQINKVSLLFCATEGWELHWKKLTTDGELLIERF